MDGTRIKILSEVTQTQTQYAFTHKWILGIKQRIIRLQSTVPEKLGNKKDPKRDTWIVLGRGNR